MRGMILAAGFGNRFLPHTARMAKPTLPFLNQALLTYTHYYLEQLGVDKLVINTHHLSYTIRAAAEELGAKCPVVYSEEQPSILGSGGGIGHARSELEGGGNFVVANGDEVLLFNHKEGFLPLKKSHDSGGALITHMVCEHPEVGKTLNGVWVDNQGLVKGYGRTPPEDGLTGYHFLGVHMISDGVFKYIPEGESNILYDVATKAIGANEKVMVHIESNPIWFETGNLDSYLLATKVCLELLAGSSVHAENLKSILDRYQQNYKIQHAADTHVFYGDGVNVSPSAAFIGSVVLGTNCHIDDAVTLENSVVARHVRALKGAHHKSELVL